MHLENKPNGLLNLADACFNRISPNKLPSEVAFIIALRLTGQPEDFTEEAERMLRAHLLGPGMTELEDLEFEGPTVETVPEDHPAGWELALTYPVMVRFEALEARAHTIDFYVNGKLQAGRSVAFWVAEPPAPPAV